MTITPESELRDVTGIGKHEIELIKAYMQGAVYSWIKNRDEPFAIRDLVGGKNTDWSNTPLYTLWEKQKGLGKEDNDAFELAAKDLGWITKSMLAEDKRLFKVEESGMVNTYRWQENE